MADMACEAENSLVLLREAFILILYHFWGKQVCNLFECNDYKPKKIFDKAKYENMNGRPRYDIKIDENGIERLRMIANTIKHNDGQGLYQSEPALFKDPLLIINEKTWGGWHILLNLVDDDIQRGFKAVRASAPGPRWSPNNPRSDRDND